MSLFDEMFSDTDRIFDRRSKAARNAPVDNLYAAAESIEVIPGENLPARANLQSRIRALKHTDPEMLAYIRELEYVEKMSGQNGQPMETTPQVTIDDLNTVYQDMRTMNRELSARIEKLENQISKKIRAPSPKIKVVTGATTQMTSLPPFKMTADDLLG